MSVQLVVPDPIFLTAVCSPRDGVAGVNRDITDTGPSRKNGSSVVPATLEPETKATEAEAKGCPTWARNSLTFSIPAGQLELDDTSQ
ncbi:hypothetical protein TREES_T100021817 [Tupaia chinensis]|uniref:Uncharacterized protein n=1 Tax=Tupaia chinensis TaxID=246437 RepID=L9JCW8_TUPCH|nr:hypothetical protein TREES_T100021817 [Tupaia chinensis]